MNERLNSTLTELGLPELLPLFESQGIDDAVLGDLSDADLREIGIEKLGDRKKMLKAFGGGMTTLGEAPSIEIISEAPKATPQDQFTYDAKNGEIIITGFRGKGHVVVPDRFDDLPLPVRVIGREAFKDNGMLLSVVLPEGVRKIDWLAFSGCSSLTRVAIPRTVIEIEPLAFDGCSSLESDCLMPFLNFGVLRRSNITSITIPEGVTSIGKSAFSDCRSLTSITIPEGVTSIGDQAFSGCSSLTNLTIPESVTSIGYQIFGDRFSLPEDGIQYVTWGNVIMITALSVSTKSIIIPSKINGFCVTSIGGGAFSGCSSLTSITIPEGVTSIGINAFDGCSSLTSITIPEGVTSIGEQVFYECSSLSSITIPEGVTSIGVGAFAGCSSLSGIKIPDGVTSIGKGAFARCSSLSSITIPEGVTLIGANVFFGCSSLSSIKIPESVTSIESFAFQGCSSLSSITIPEGVTSIGDHAFMFCASQPIVRKLNHPPVKKPAPKGFFSKLFS